MPTPETPAASRNTEEQLVGTLPCPFCGCPFVSVTTLRHAQTRVACGQCLAEMTGGCSRDNMVRQWNRRANGGLDRHPDGGG